MSCGVGFRCSSVLVLLWLWHRPAAVDPIKPLAWRSSTCCGCGPKKKKRKKRNSCYVGPSLRLEKGELHQVAHKTKDKYAKNSNKEKSSSKRANRKD